MAEPHPYTVLQPPAEPLAYARPSVRVPGVVGQFLLRPAGWTVAAVSASAAVLTLVAAADFVGPLMAYLIAAVCWLVAGGVVAVRVVGHVASVAIYGRPDAGPGGSQWWRWAIGPALFGATVALWRADVPSAVVFYFRRPARERAAVAALASPTAFQPRAPVGVCSTSTPEVDGDAVNFPVVGMSGMDAYGYVYSPAGPTFRRYHGAWPIGGPWYRWR